MRIEAGSTNYPRVHVQKQRLRAMDGLRMALLRGRSIFIPEQLLVFDLQQKQVAVRNNSAVMIAQVH